MSSSSSSFSVDVQGLTVRFGDFTAVDKISFQVRPGEIFGFLGANGAGKTTTIRVLCGLIEPNEGEVRVMGLNPKSGLDAIKARVGYMSQKFTLYDDLTVGENLDFTASLRKLSEIDYKKRKEYLLQFIGFDRPLTTLVKDLPGGMKQQVSLCASTLHDPDIVFLDEPTAGVTPAYRARFWNLIRVIAKSGKTVFVTTHYMDEAEQCDRIALMREGKLIALDSPEGLKKASYPEPLYEIVPPAHASQTWVTELRAQPFVVSLQPHGLRYHAELMERSEESNLRKLLPSDFKVRVVPPSLEDVFIRLVEGRTPEGGIK